MGKIRDVLQCLAKVFGDDRETRQLTQRIEEVQEKATDISHDLHVSRQRSDTLYRLVMGMRGPNDVH
jgi:hypothetical protein